jgi:hypothetical protein
MKSDPAEDFQKLFQKIFFFSLVLSEDYAIVQILKKGTTMTMDELMARILEILPEAEFGEEPKTGEIIIATGLVNEIEGNELKKVF